MSHPIPFRTRTLNPFAPMVLCLKARESRSLPGLLNIIWNEFFLLQVFKPPAFARGFFNGSSETLFADAGRFRPVFASLRRIGVRFGKMPALLRQGILRPLQRLSCGHAFHYMFCGQKWRGSRKVYKIKGRTKCNEYEKFDTCSRKIAHCLSSSFLYNLFRNLIHVIILFYPYISF